MSEVEMGRLELGHVSDPCTLDHYKHVQSETENQFLLSRTSISVARNPARRKRQALVKKRKVAIGKGPSPAAKTSWP
jgi:hypothetical protein